MTGCGRSRRVDETQSTVDRRRRRGRTAGSRRAAAVQREVGGEPQRLSQVGDVTRDRRQDRQQVLQTDIESEPKHPSPTQTKTLV